MSANLYPGFGYAISGLAVGVLGDDVTLDQGSPSRKPLPAF